MSELKLPFDEQLIPFDDGNSWEKFRAFSPTGLVPCLIDGDRPVWESLAIIEYLAERHAGVWPADDGARAWARSAASEMHAGFSAIRNECPMTVGLRIKLHQQTETLARDLSRLDELWIRGMETYGGPFLAGDTFSAVDAFFAPVAFRVQTYNLPLSAQAQSYVAHLLGLEGMQAWTQAALTEPFREPSHEDEISALGECISDLRK